MNMKVCPNCGEKENPEVAKFCKHCRHEFNPKVSIGLNTIIGLILTFVLTITLLFFVVREIDEDSLRFWLSLGLGVISGSCLFFLLKSWIVDKKIVWYGIWNCLSFVLTLFSLLIAFDPDSFYQKFLPNEVINTNNDTVRIVDEFNDIDKDKHHMIFAFDKTKYNSKDSIIPTELQNDYRMYILSFNNIHKVQNVAKVSYREFCRAMLCAKLCTLKKENVEGRFSIYLLANDAEHLFEGNLNNEEDIEEAIVRLYGIVYYDDNLTESNLLNFYEKLYSRIEKDVFNPHEFTKHVLYIYSDFVHDTRCRNSTEFDQEIKKIKEIKTKIKNQSIVQNLYVIPHKKMNKKNNQEYILDPNAVFLYKNVFSLEACKPSKRESKYDIHKTKKSKKNIPIFYSNSEVGYSPNLSFSDRYFVHIGEDTGILNPPTIYLKARGNDDIIINHKYIQIPGGTPSIEYHGHISEGSPPIYIDIVNEKGTHCQFKLEFKEFKEFIPSFWSWLLPLICCLSGVSSAVFLLWGLSRVGKTIEIRRIAKP